MDRLPDLLRRLVFAGALVVLAACSGGGSVAPRSAAPAVPSRTAIAHGTLTLRFPAGFRTAKGVTRRTGASTRHPAYVNPASGNLIDIFVGGTLVTNLDGVTPSDSVTVMPTPDGTQTIANVPLFSSGQDVAVIEWDSSGLMLLAIGEAPSVSFAAGGTPTITLTMQMNATGFAITTHSDGSSASMMNGYFTGGATGTPNQVYIYATDPLGGYVTAAPPSGSGGFPTNVSVTGVPNDGSHFGSQIIGSYAVSFLSVTSDVVVAATASNPAGLAAADTTNYPFLAGGYLSSIQQLFSSNDTATVNLVPTGFVLPQSVYVANRGTGVLAFPITASGNVAPSVNISGGNTTLNSPVALALDASGNIYTANDSGDGLTTFGAGANGNAFPTKSFTDTTAIATEGAVVDAVGNMYVASYSPASIAVFAPGSSGSVAPSYVISGGSTGLIEPLGLALDGSGNLYVADGGGSVEVFASGANGNATPIAVISGGSTNLSGNHPDDIAIDGSGRIIVALEGTGCCNNDGSIVIFSSGANGNVAPVAQIVGPATGIHDINGVAVDGAGNIWASDPVALAIFRFSGAANANVAPLQTIQGISTQLNDPQKIKVH
jgi:hypothetical protein